MPRYGAKNNVSGQPTTCLLNGEYAAASGSNRISLRVFNALPPRDRSLLRLFYQRGATQAEVAALMGISRKSVRLLLRRILARVRDPLVEGLVAIWGHLEGRDQRLAYLHCLRGLSLRAIARNDLLRDSAEPGGRPTPSVTTLRRRMRRMQRQVGRALARRDHPPAEPPADRLER